MLSSAKVAPIIAFCLPALEYEAERDRPTRHLSVLATTERA